MSDDFDPFSVTPDETPNYSKNINNFVKKEDNESAKKDVSSKLSSIKIDEAPKDIKIQQPITSQINYPQKNIVEESKSPININKPVQSNNNPSFDINWNVNNNINNNNYNNYNNNNLFKNNNSGLRRNVSDICQECINNFIECTNCEGYFDIEYFYSKHESFCKLLYDLYKEKEDLVDCQECRSMIKFNDFQKHKEVCQGNPDINTERMKCAFCNLDLPLEMIEEHEAKCEKEQQDVKLLRELIKCNYCNENVPVSFLENHEKSCLKLKENKEFIEKGLAKSDIEYPKEWGDDGFDLLYTLTEHDQEYRDVMKAIRISDAAIKITDIHRIQSKFLWDRYYRERLKIIKEKGSCRETFLFQAQPDVSPNIIYVTGFDISFTKEGEAYGRGIHFYNLASVAKNLSFKEKNKKYLFYAKVLTGNAFVSAQNTGLRKPPFFDSNKFIYYDSVTNIKSNKKNDALNSIHVIYNNEKAYPSYLIEYKG